jgi:hypothetical protein
MPLNIPKIKDVPVSAVEYRIRIFQPNGSLYGAPFLFRSTLLTTTGAATLPYGENGDIVAELDTLAMTIGTNIKNTQQVGSSVKVGRRWIYDGGNTDYDNVGEIPPITVED